VGGSGVGAEGSAVGWNEDPGGKAVGAAVVGTMLGAAVGASVGIRVGTVGTPVGANVGSSVGGAGVGGHKPQLLWQFCSKASSPACE